MMITGVVSTVAVETVPLRETTEERVVLTVTVTVAAEHVVGSGVTAVVGVSSFEHGRPLMVNLGV